MKNFNLPLDHKPYIDKYFLRSKEILQKEDLNPMVKAQVFIRKGNCKVYGIDEAISILTKYSNIEKTGHVYSLKEGDNISPSETLMIIEAPIQEIIDLETMYLGVLSAETTLRNGGEDIKIGKVCDNMAKIVELVGDRSVSYFGARHWRYDQDVAIATACKIAGADNCSTDIGAKAWGFDCEGVGTIPHILESVYHWKYGIDKAVLEATKAFDRHIDPSVPRIALIDYANKEITDTMELANTFGDKLEGIRLDTCGENFIQYAPPSLKIIDSLGMEKYWWGTGVSLFGVVNLKLRINKFFPNMKLTLSSGFGDIEKVKAFVDAETKMKTRLFERLGVGGVFDSRMATMDVIEIEGKEIHKVGREAKPNARLTKVF